MSAFRMPDRSLSPADKITLTASLKTECSDEMKLLNRSEPKPSNELIINIHMQEGQIAEAAAQIGWHYLKLKEYKKSYPWIIKSAELGDYHGQYLLAYLYRTYEEISPDLTATAYWYIASLNSTPSNRVSLKSSIFQECKLIANLGSKKKSHQPEIGNNLQAIFDIHTMLLKDNLTNLDWVENAIKTLITRLKDHPKSLMDCHYKTAKIYNTYVPDDFKKSLAHSKKAFEIAQEEKLSSPEDKTKYQHQLQSLAKKAGDYYEAKDSTEKAKEYYALFHQLGGTMDYRTAASLLNLRAIKEKTLLESKKTGDNLFQLTYLMESLQKNKTPAAALHRIQLAMKIILLTHTSMTSPLINPDYLTPSIKAEIRSMALAALKENEPGKSTKLTDSGLLASAALSLFDNPIFKLMLQNPFSHLQVDGIIQFALTDSNRLIPSLSETTYKKLSNLYNGQDHADREVIEWIDSAKSTLNTEVLDYIYSSSKDKLKTKDTDLLLIIEYLCLQEITWENICQKNLYCRMLYIELYSATGNHSSNIFLEKMIARLDEMLPGFKQAIIKIYGLSETIIENTLAGRDEIKLCGNPRNHIIRSLLYIFSTRAIRYITPIDIMGALNEIDPWTPHHLRIYLLKVLRRQVDKINNPEIYREYLNRLEKFEPGCDQIPLYQAKIAALSAPSTRLIAQSFEEEKQPATSLITSPPLLSKSAVNRPELIVSPVNNDKAASPQYEPFVPPLYPSLVDCSTIPDIGISEKQKDLPLPSAPSLDDYPLPPPPYAPLSNNYNNKLSLFSSPPVATAIQPSHRAATTLENKSSLLNHLLTANQQSIKELAEQAKTNPTALGILSLIAENPQTQSQVTALFYLTLIHFDHFQSDVSVCLDLCHTLFIQIEKIGANLLLQDYAPPIIDLLTEAQQRNPKMEDVLNQHIDQWEKLFFYEIRSNRQSLVRK